MDQLDYDWVLVYEKIYIVFIQSIDVLFSSIIVIDLICLLDTPFDKLILEIAIFVNSMYTPYVDVHYLMNGWYFLGIPAL